MTADELLDRLCPPKGYPMTPHEASRLIVDEMLADLSAERREAIRDVLWEWSSQRENAVAGTVYESSAER